MTLATPHVGNYGVKDGEEESTKISIAGLGGEEIQRGVEPSSGGDGSVG